MSSFGVFGFLFLVGIVALLLFRKKTYKYRIVSLLCLALYLFSNKAIQYGVLSLYEYKLQRHTEVKHYRYGIVLGGMTTYEPISYRLQFTGTADRLFQGAVLLGLHNIDTLIISGGSDTGHKGEPIESFQSKAFLKGLGMNGEQILVEGKSRTTYENALFVKEGIDHLHLKGPFLLISSAYHLPRALRCFKKMGIEVVPYAADVMAKPTSQNWAYYVVPQAEVLHNWDIIFHEWIGMMYYKLKGYI